MVVRVSVLAIVGLAAGSLVGLQNMAHAQKPAQAPAAADKAPTKPEPSVDGKKSGDPSGKPAKSTGKQSAPKDATKQAPLKPEPAAAPPTAQPKAEKNQKKKPKAAEPSKASEKGKEPAAANKSAPEKPAQGRERSDNKPQRETKPAQKSSETPKGDRRSEQVEPKNKAAEETKRPAGDKPTDANPATENKAKPESQPAKSEPSAKPEPAEADKPKPNESRDPKRDARRQNKSDADAKSKQETSAKELSRTDLKDGQRARIDGGSRVIRRENGRAFIRHDDDRRFRRQGGDRRVEQLPNGRTRIIISLPRGGEIITVRGRDGEIIRRVRRTPDGRRIVLIDNRDRGPRPLAEFNFGPLTITIPRERYIVDSGRATPGELREALTAPPIERVERDYSLEEIRRYDRIRDKMRRIDVSAITFELDSSEISRSQALKLESLGQTMHRVLERNPDEVFLIEGHTDATGTEIHNLALSDRRAESVALALTEIYEVPAENLVTQGYGEAHLKIATQEQERENRRVTVRRITPLLRGADARGRQ